MTQQSSSIIQQFAGINDLLANSYEEEIQEIRQVQEHYTKQTSELSEKIQSLETFLVDFKAVYEETTREDIRMQEMMNRRGQYLHDLTKAYNEELKQTLFQNKKDRERRSENFKKLEAMIACLRAEDEAQTQRDIKTQDLLSAKENRIRMVLQTANQEFQNLKQQNDQAKIKLKDAISKLDSALVGLKTEQNELMERKFQNLLKLKKSNSQERIKLQSPLILNLSEAIETQEKQEEYIELLEAMIKTEATFSDRYNKMYEKELRKLKSMKDPHAIANAKKNTLENLNKITASHLEKVTAVLKKKGLKCSDLDEGKLVKKREHMSRLEPMKQMRPTWMHERTPRTE